MLFCPVMMSTDATIPGMISNGLSSLPRWLFSIRSWIRQIRRARHLSLAEVFRMEYAMSLNCYRHSESPEGVRARLIDKDQAPKWHWPDPAAIPQAVIEAHFTPAWEGAPLADL